MSDLVRVWDKEGNMFEVSPINASDFIQHLGWTGKNPKAEAETKAVSEESDAEGEDSSGATDEAPKAKRGRPTLKLKAQDEAPTE